MVTRANFYINWWQWPPVFKMPTMVWNTLPEWARGGNIQPIATSTEHFTIGCKIHYLI